MIRLVELSELKSRLRIFDCDDDDDRELESLILAASQAVVDYLGSRASEVLGLDENGDLPEDASVPQTVSRATIIVADYLNDESYAGDPDRPGGLPVPAEMLLYRLTDPPLA